jgi:DNA polymerase III delta subunit
MTEAARRFTLADLRAAFTTLAAADLALKGGKSPPETALEQATLAISSTYARQDPWS